MKADSTASPIGIVSLVVYCLSLLEKQMGNTREEAGGHTSRSKWGILKSFLYSARVYSNTIDSEVVALAARVPIEFNQYKSVSLLPCC